MPRTDATASTTCDARTGRTVRRRVLRTAVAGLTAVAALTLTACGSQEDALKTAPAKPFHPAAETAAGAEPAAAGYHSGQDDRAQTATTRRSACDAATMRIVAKRLPRPVNHVLLEATNTTGTACDLYGYPRLRFDDAQASVADLPESKPQAVVTLAPGESGYAAVMTSAADGSGHHGGTRTSLTAGLPGRDGKGSVGGSAHVPLPGGSVYVDDSAWVTYWQPNPSDAASW
ncbi:DUF4232 domain-containing protein [Streptomyces halobius]|uniref:DUF4232 domain-containing protein n=1 Tax=Streptomyces halobius TaxID=2879846 RepID=A0ABY4M993_9ACTN|nr:DUF4232 domain-containing protein [Streptomyces halobius]UQA94359.1 DUF4232 domain-containing protein [Streptomyces halobius]